MASLSTKSRSNNDNKARVISICSESKIEQLF
jgi:hypothetical protein